MQSSSGSCCGSFSRVPIGLRAVDTGFAQARPAIACARRAFRQGAASVSNIGISTFEFVSVFGFRISCFLVALLIAQSAEAQEWHLSWSCELPARKTAWEFTQRMGRDVGYPVAAGGGLAFVGCEHNGALLAFDGQTGEERWRFYTAAPIRHAPVADDTHVYVGSDDGSLHCLDGKGKVVWKRRGGPSDRLVIGHERVMSAWPISTEPLLHDGVLYFVAGYWPVDGIYLHAVDAKSGKEIWVNDSAEFRPNRKIHWLDGKLLIDGDNSKAIVDAKTGEVLREKVDKPASPERPKISGAKGNMTSWSQSGDTLTVGTTEGVFGFSFNRTAGTRDSGSGLRESGEKTKATRDADPRSHVPGTRLNEAADILAKTGVKEGYCLVVGPSDAAFVAGLLAKSGLHVVALEKDEQAADKLRRHFDARGLFDEHRLAVVVGDSTLPPYFASLIVANADEAVTDAIRRGLHPYRGAIATIKASDGIKITRGNGPPAGSADWTHEFRDAANSLASPDKLVKAPLGLLWYGGPAADARFYFDGNVDHQSGHGLNPQPVPAQVVDGRMILQGPGLLAAIDIYTGRILWETPLPKMYTFGGGGGGLGIHSKKHPRPWEYEEAYKFEVTPVERCRASGFDCVSQSDGIYVAAAKHLLRFDPATGELLSKWAVPDLSRTGTAARQDPATGKSARPTEDLRWGNVRVSGNTIVATLFRPQDIADAQAGFDGNGGDWAGDRMPMSHLIAVDRQSGKLLWSREADWGFLNRSGICVGGGNVYCVDLITEKIYDKYQDAGRKFPDVPPTLHAFDLATGNDVWQFPLDVYVQNIAYSESKDLLLAPCRNLKEWRDGKWVDLSIDIRRGKRDKNAAGKWRALRGKTGQVVWEEADAAYHSPHIVLGDLIIDRSGYSYDLNTGKRHLRTLENGEQEEWNFKKGGCNHLIACENLVTWRCAYYDLVNHESVNLTGMDAGCSPTLIPAGGVLNVPNFGTHHKRNRMTAMALVHVE